MSTVVPGGCHHGELMQKAEVKVPLRMALFHSLALIIPIMHFHMRRWRIVNSTCVCHEVWAQLHHNLFLSLFPYLPGKLCLIYQFLSLKDLRDGHLNTHHMLKEGRERVAPPSLAPVPFLPLCQSPPPPHWLDLWVKFTHSSAGEFHIFCARILDLFHNLVSCLEILTAY